MMMSQRAISFAVPYTLRFYICCSLAMHASLIMYENAVQATKATGHGLDAFDPDQWLSNDRTQVQLNTELGNFSFGAGARRCVGQFLAITELTTALAILAREVQRVDITEEETNREFFILGHPTGMPLKLIVRSSGKVDTCTRPLSMVEQ
jgi:hypothetical protein